MQAASSRKAIPTTSSPRLRRNARARSCGLSSTERSNNGAVSLAGMNPGGFEPAVVSSRGGGTRDNCGDALYLANHYATNGGLDSAIWSARSFSGVIPHAGSEPQLHIDEPTPRPDIIAIRDIHSHNHPFKGVAEALVARGVTGRVALVGTQVIPVEYYPQLGER